MILLLNTHTILWLTEDSPNLGRAADRACEAALAAAEIAVPSAVFFEIGYQVKRGRMRGLTTVREWRERVVTLGVREVPLSAEIAIQAAELDDMHGDPWDRVIIATAIVEEATLLTADREMLAWPGKLERQDARR